MAADLKTSKHAKKQETVTHDEENNQSEVTQILQLAPKDIKTIIPVSQIIQKLSIEIEDLSKTNKNLQLLEMKTMSKMKNILEGIDSRLDRRRKDE